MNPMYRRRDRDKERRDREQRRTIEDPMKQLEEELEKQWSRDRHPSALHQRIS